MESEELLKITDEEVRRFTKKKDKTKGSVRDIEYTVYEVNSYGKLANSFFEAISYYFIHKFSHYYKTLKSSLTKSDIKLLSITYVSVMFFSAFLTLVISLFSIFVISLLFETDLVMILLRSIGISFLLGISMFVFLYFYPAIVAQSRNRAIVNDLPFATIHMAAVSGTGAQPISMFNLVQNTGGYKGLEREIRKIINYVNLFGYDLSTALRSVAFTTPSARFRELLVGIVAILETGGDLSSYLKSKADDALTTYKLEREKYVESLATYSDVYTGVLIAAPLLFIVTLAIINLIGGSIMGFDASTLAFLGTFFVIPFFNVLFIIFLNFIQPEA